MQRTQATLFSWSKTKIKDRTREDDSRSQRKTGKPRVLPRRRRGRPRRSKMGEKPSGSAGPARQNQNQRLLG